MYKIHKTHIKPDMKMLDLIDENPSFLLLLQHFDIDFVVNELTVKEICAENNVSLNVFLVIGNLYNGFYSSSEQNYTTHDIETIIKYLHNNHKFYQKEKYPEIKDSIELLRRNHDSKDIELIEVFFNNYFNEVLEHLKYEEEVVFPYFYSLTKKAQDNTVSEFSAKQYLEYHTDIETKLTDLKNLLLKHIRIKGSLPERRRLLNNLFGLEFDLEIHSIVEEKVLIPLVEKIEKERNEKAAD